jgi:hypothetical protein
MPHGSEIPLLTRTATTVYYGCFLAIVKCASKLLLCFKFLICNEFFCCNTQALDSPFSHKPARRQRTWKLTR